MKNILIKIIKKYQSIPFKSHDSCKFIPTCSNYMIEALEEHGLIKGLFLGTKRLLRCNPFTNEKYTYDPVPKKKKQTINSLLEYHMAGDERIELPTVVLETIIIPFN